VIVNATAIFERLMSSIPDSLANVPQGSGIYALYDHEGDPRYIGITGKDLRDRIYSRHAAGDGNSHKFSTVYNAGRMFHTRRHPATCSTDGAVAKELRRHFARRHCAAVAIPLPGVSFQQLLALEHEVCRLVPPDARRWNDTRALEVMEPTELVNDLLRSLGWDGRRLAAVERQAERWHSLKSSV
jgi:hypothetical protein